MEGITLTLTPSLTLLEVIWFQKNPKSQDSQKSQSKLFILKGWRSKISNFFRFLWTEGLLKKLFILYWGVAN